MSFFLKQKKLFYILLDVKYAQDKISFNQYQTIVTMNIMKIWSNKRWQTWRYLTNHTLHPQKELGEIESTTKVYILK